MSSSSQTLLSVRHLSTSFRTDSGTLEAVQDISFDVHEGETVGLVGESGCGKSVTAESLMRLLDPEVTEYRGEVVLDGEDLLQLSEAHMRERRGHGLSMIFQDPMTSLNPVYRVGTQLIETIRLHQDVDRAEARRIAVRMLELTGIPAPERRMNDYPHQMSGGMRQRVFIAMALSCQPRLLIADEPTTALDVTTQAQILELIERLKSELAMGTIFITHDLGVVAETCDRVVVMYLGQVIEVADVADLFDQPLHPYTQGLLAASPSLDTPGKSLLPSIPGSVPTLREIPEGCRFAARCPFATEVCRSEVPQLEEFSPGHSVRCWHAADIQAAKTNLEGEDR